MWSARGYSGMKNLVVAQRVKTTGQLTYGRISPDRRHHVKEKSNVSLIS